jgi:hypothetical protein
MTFISVSDDTHIKQTSFPGTPSFQILDSMA